MHDFIFLHSCLRECLFSARIILFGYPPISFVMVCQVKQTQKELPQYYYIIFSSSLFLSFIHVRFVSSLLAWILRAKIIIQSPSWGKDNISHGHFGLFFPFGCLLSSTPFAAKIVCHILSSFCHTLLLSSFCPTPL